MPTLGTGNIIISNGCQFWEQKILSFLWMPGRRPHAYVVLKLCIGRREMRGEGIRKCVGL